MSAFEAVDIYCERLAPGLWAEPINTLSNLAFLVAAYLLWRYAAASPSSARREIRGMAILLALVGAASFAFHLSGQRWGEWLDAGLIAVFILSFLYRFLRSVGRQPRWLAILALLAFLVGTHLIEGLGDLGMNGSEGYLLPSALLLLMTSLAQHWAPPAARWLLWACASFAVSLTLRTLDMRLCPSFALGLHFGWHLLNAGVLYFCVRGLAAGRSARERA